MGNYDGESPAGTGVLGMFRGRDFGGPFSLLVGWIFKSKGTGYIRMVSHPIIYDRLVFLSYLIRLD